MARRDLVKSAMKIRASRKKQLSGTLAKMSNTLPNDARTRGHRPDTGGYEFYRPRRRRRQRPILPHQEARNA